MPVDRSFVEQNRTSTQRIRTLAGRLSDAQMQKRVGEQWTVAVVLAHLAFWDRRVLYVLDRTEAEGKLASPEIDNAVNDIGLPLMAAVPPKEAARLAIETAESLDARLEKYPPALLEQVYNFNKRFVVRALHRGEHLDEVDKALKS